MKSFKCFLEETNSVVKEKLQEIKNSVKEELIGSNEDLTTTFDSLKDNNLQGAKFVLNKLIDLDVFNRMRELGSKYDNLATTTQSWLENSPKLATIGELMIKLFGEED